MVLTKIVTTGDLKLDKEFFFTGECRTPKIGETYYSMEKLYLCKSPIKGDYWIVKNFEEEFAKVRVGNDLDKIILNVTKMMDQYPGYIKWPVFVSKVVPKLTELRAFRKTCKTFGGTTWFYINLEANSLA